MNFTKHLEYKPKKQIWRILITDDEKIIFEKRDTTDKQVYFDAVDLKSKQEIFNNLQLDEKFWIGIEKVYKGIIYFHKYPKPDMPDHKEIIAYEIESGKILWRNEEYSFLFLYDDKVFCFKQQFEGRRFYSLDYKSGELIEDVGSDAETVNKIYDKSRVAEDFSDYIFPETNIPSNQNVKSIIDDLKRELEIVGEVEYNIYKDCVFASYHIKIFEKSMMNKFVVIDTKSKEELFNEKIVANTESFMTDSFFIYKNFLFLLKGKDEVLIYEIG